MENLVENRLEVKSVGKSGKGSWKEIDRSIDRSRKMDQRIERGRRNRDTRGSRPQTIPVSLN